MRAHEARLQSTDRTPIAAFGNDAPGCGQVRLAWGVDGDNSPPPDFLLDLEWAGGGVDPHGKFWFGLVGLCHGPCRM